MDVKLPRESLWTPWGSTQLRSGAYMCARSSSGSAEALPDNAGVVFAFPGRVSTPEGVSEPPLFVPYQPTVVGGLKRQEPRMWFLHPRMFRHFLCPQALETYQGVSLDSLGVGAIEIGCIFAPNHRRRCQEAPKRVLAMPTVFLCWIFVAWGGWGLYLFIPAAALCVTGTLT
jgi:hypothetical protein